jgi:ubiquinone/menaquinone biosynthesis C-methylase UbiE
MSGIAEMGDFSIFLYSAVTLAAIYLGGGAVMENIGLGSKAVPVKRRRAWIITAFSSVVMTAVGFYFFAQVVSSGGAILQTPTAELDAGDVAIARALCIFFLAYCVVDVVFISLHYSEYANIGVEHHIGYFVLILYLLAIDRSFLFAVLALEEFPTLIISFLEIKGEENPRLAVGLGIFAFRISYHLLITYLSAMSDSNTGLFFLSVFLLLHHIAWFRSWFFKRVAAKRAKDDAKAAEKKNPTSPAKGEKRSSIVKALELEVVHHVYLVMGLATVQTLLHAYLVMSELNNNFRVKADWSTFSFDLVSLCIVMFAHFISFIIVTIRMAGIVHDVYTEHFIMHAIHEKTIIYNISWEDPRVERELLGITKDDVILTISSAGCNVLDYLIDGPKHIIACDFNAAQIAVLELKLACIKHLDHDRFFRIWAESDFPLFEAEYKKTLRSKLTAPTQEFWDDNHHLIKDNFMFAGTSGLAAKMLVPPLRMLGLTDYMLERKLYPPASVGLAIIRIFLAQKWVWGILAPLGGVPESQLNLVAREPHVWIDRMEEVIARRMWMKDNYFYYAYIAGKWSKECCPRYMEEQHFAALKKNANNVTLFHGPIAAASKLRDDITIASLLDSMDWMPDWMIADQFATLVPQMKTHKSCGKSHIFWRTFATKVHSPVLASLLPELVPDEDGRERVGWYLTQWVAETPDAVEYAKLLCKGETDVPKNTLVDDAMVISAMLAEGMRTEKDVKAFYKSQGNNYDGFREALLPDRDRLLQYCLPWHKKPAVWLSVGCGTARDIEYVVGHIKDCKTRVYLLDLSPELLAMAQERVNRLGLQDQVTTVGANIMEAYDSKGQPKGDLKGKLPAMDTIDIVTCSYCLTMIPPWKEALESMVKVLKKGGTFALVDFTQRSDCPNHWTQKLNTWWFHHDGVDFDVEHTNTLRNHPDLKTVWFQEAEARVPYTPLQATHYVYTGIKL